MKSTGYDPKTIIKKPKLFSIPEINFGVKEINVNYLFPKGNQTIQTKYLYAHLPKYLQNDVKKILLYFHATSLDRMAVPSSSTTNYYKSIAAMYAANGYIVVMIDYVGEGGGSAFQPYVLFPHDNVQTGIKAVESVMD